jgi:hypothetical protein
MNRHKDCLCHVFVFRLSQTGRGAMLQSKGASCHGQLQSISSVTGLPSKTLDYVCIPVKQYSEYGAIVQNNTAAIILTVCVWPYIMIMIDLEHRKRVDFEDLHRSLIKHGWAQPERKSFSMTLARSSFFPYPKLAKSILRAMTRSCIMSRASNAWNHVTCSWEYM